MIDPQLPVGKQPAMTSDAPENATAALVEIRRLIEGGSLGPDGRLPTERALVAHLGIGRRAVRRALEALEAEGLIWRRQGKGTFAGQPPSPTEKIAAEIREAVDPAEVMEARIALEPALAGLAAARATPADVARLRHLADRTDEAADSDAAELWDGALHRLIARLAGNPVLMAAFALLDDVRVGEDWQTQRHRARTATRRAAYDRQHRAIVEAIAAGDAAAARNAMALHLGALAENMQAASKEGRAA